MKKLLLIPMAALMFGCSDTTDKEETDQVNEPQEEVETVENTAETDSQVTVSTPTTKAEPMSADEQEYFELILEYKTLFEEKRDTIIDITATLEEDVALDGTLDNMELLGELHGNVIAVGVIYTAIDEMTTTVVPTKFAQSHFYLLRSLEEMNHAGIYLMNAFTENGYNAQFYNELLEKQHAKYTFDYIGKFKDEFYRSANGR